jgi:hypothetical protein
MWFVTMHRAICARGFVFTIRALLEAYFCVVQKCGAVFAELVARVVAVGTIYVDHFAHGSEFALQVPGFRCHVYCCLDRVPNI